MERKSFWTRLFFPPAWLLPLLLTLSAAGLTWVFGNGRTDAPAAYGIYLTAFYTLCAVSAFCCRVLPGQYKRVRETVAAHPVGSRYLTDPAFRTHVKLYTSLAINLLYVAVNLLSRFLYGSMWFVVLAVYYGILAVMRFLLLRYVRGSGIGTNYLGELRRARSCACILLLLNFVLTGAVMMILYQNKGFEYHGLLIYVMAAYTFYITTRAAVDLVKYRKYKSPVMTVSKVISLSAALVSMLALETAMFSQFGGDMTPESQRLMIILTGAGVSFAVIGLSSYMIVKTTHEIEEKQNNGSEKRDF